MRREKKKKKKRERKTCIVDVNIDDYERDRNSNINALNVRKGRKRGKEKIREVIIGTNGKEVMM
jgi:hypothetical protein